MSNFLLVLCICKMLSTLWIQFLNGLDAFEGYHVTLKCPYKANLGRTLGWFRINESLVEVYSQNSVINTFILSPDVYQRLAVTGNNTAGEYNLNISDIRKSDEGIYECSISGTDSINRQHITVIDKPHVKIKNVTPDNRLLGIEGKSMLIQCIADGGELPPDVKLYISEKNVASGKQSARYTLISQRSNDDQIVKCIAGYEEFTYYPVTDVAILYIKMLPLRLYFLGLTDNKLEGKEGTDLLIRCIADGGKPPPNVSIINGRVSNGIQEVNYKISNISREYHEKSIACNASIDAIDILMTITVQIYLSLKPLAPMFNSNEVSTEETVPLTVSCTSYGSLPAATFTWTIGGNNVTTSSTISLITTESNNTITITSTLISSVNKSHNNQSIICNASNPVGSASASKTLDVKYAPGITVVSPIYTQNDGIRTVTCNPSGNPDIYTYYKWQHRTRYGEIIREFSGNETLKLPDVPVLRRYQDNGVYVCTAGNGVKDKYNYVEQTGSGHVTINAEPVFTPDTHERVKQSCEMDEDVELYVNVYSIPKFTSFVWTRYGKPLKTQNSSKYISASSPTIVKDVIHGKEVKQDGYNITLTIRDLRTDDLSIYAVTLRSGFGHTIYTIVLESSNTPELPGNFSRIESATTSVTVQWDPNSGCGYKQSFYMQYRVQGLLEWTTVLVGEQDVSEPKRRRTYELRNLQYGKAYELRLYAENTAGKRSNFTDVLIVSTENSVSSSVIDVVAGVGVTLVIVSASVIVIKLFKWRKGKNKTKKKDEYHENIGFKDVQKGDEYDEIGNTCDVEHTLSGNTYEPLGTNMTKDVLNVYDDLENPQGVTSAKSSCGHYEALGVQNLPSIYDDMINQKEPSEKGCANEVP